MHQPVHRLQLIHSGEKGGGDEQAYGAIDTPELSILAARLDEALGENADEARRIVDLFLPMDTDRAELVATLFACWNDLLARGESPDGQAIIREFHGWAEGKRRLETERLEKALEWMREHGLVPTGQAKPTAARKGAGQKTVASGPDDREVGDAVHEAIARLLDERGVIASADAQQATGLDAASVRPYLKRLVDEGRGITDGQRRGMKYRRTHHA